MPNEDYSPSDEEEIVLELFKQGRNTGSPWGRLNPLYIRESTDLDKGQVENALQNLRMAGWIRHINNGGLYELSGDPRSGSNTHQGVDSVDPTAKDTGTQDKEETVETSSDEGAEMEESEEDGEDSLFSRLTG